MDKQNAINLQLLGGIWILQTFPAIVFSLYTRWFHRWALLAGWAVGMTYGTVAAYNVSSAATSHFGGSLSAVPVWGQMGYIAVTAFVLNVVVAAVLTLILRAAKVARIKPRGASGAAFKKDWSGGARVGGRDWLSGHRAVLSQSLLKHVKASTVVASGGSTRLWAGRIPALRVKVRRPAEQANDPVVAANVINFFDPT